MAEWTHRCCERCYFDGPELYLPNEGQENSYEIYNVAPPGQNEDGTFRMPVQVKDAEPGVCCFCGGLTITGILVPHDQDELLCKGRHDPAEASTWARVDLTPKAPTEAPTEAPAEPAE